MTKTTATEAVAAAMAAQQKSDAKMSVAQRIKSSGNMLGLTQNEISQYLMGMRDRVAMVLPKHLTPERVISMAATTIARDPKIAKCSPASLLGSVMQASILGFPPVDALGYCYFVPYGNSVQFQIGYKGMIELARRSGKIKMVYAEVVREGDDFSVEMGLDPKLHHVPNFDSKKKMTHVYAVCHFKDGCYNVVVLSASDIERLRLRSPMQKAQPSGAWLTDYDAMAKAKALKQLAKYMPLNIDQQTAIATDETVLTPDNFEHGQVKVEDIEYQDVTEESEQADIASEGKSKQNEETQKEAISATQGKE